MNRNYLELFEEAKKGNQLAISELEILANSIPPNRDILTALGTCYFEGYAVSLNYKKAYSLYEQSANLNCDIAMYGLGLMFQYGFGVEINLQTAIHWYYESAKKISSKTIAFNKSVHQLEELTKNISPSAFVFNILGNCYQYGFGTPQNYTKAIEMYAKAVQQNCDIGMYNFALTYQYGLGVTQNYGLGVIKNLSVAKYWFSESTKRITDATIHINQSKIRLNEIHNGINNEKKSSSPYDAQVVIDFLNKGPFFSIIALTLSNKWNLKNNNLCHLMQGEDLLQRPDQFAISNPHKKLRIYIVGHCWIASDYLHFEEENKKIHFKELADALVNYIGDQPSVINLIACCAGKESKENGEDSFAAKLHSTLVDKLKKDILVIARTSLASVWSHKNQKITFKIDELEKYKANYDSILPLTIIHDTKNEQLYEHHQANSKVMFMMKDNKQISCDAYNGIPALKQKWKYTTLNKLNELQKTTLIKSQENLIKNWIIKFDAMPADDISQILQKEIMDKKSLVKDHASPFLNFFSMFFKIPTDTEKKLQELIADFTKQTPRL